MVARQNPAQLLAARVAAFARGDFGAIWDSYHADSPFREHFPRRDAYREFAAEQLQGAIVIESCRVLAEEPGDDRHRLIFLQRLRVRGKPQETLEMASFYREQGEWRYHSSQKIDRASYPGAPESISFAYFDLQEEKIIF